MLAEWCLKPDNYLNTLSPCVTKKIKTMVKPYYTAYMVSYYETTVRRRHWSYTRGDMTLHYSYTTPTVGVPCIVPYCVYCVLYWSYTRGDMTYSMYSWSYTRGDMTYSMYCYVRLLLWGYGRGECSYCWSYTRGWLTYCYVYRYLVYDWSCTRGDMTY